MTRSYETDDGTSADMAGQNKLIGDQEGIEMRGSYTYVSPEGKKVTVRYAYEDRRRYRHRTKIDRVSYQLSYKFLIELN